MSTSMNQKSSTAELIEPRHRAVLAALFIANGGTAAAILLRLEPSAWHALVLAVALLLGLATAKRISSVAKAAALGLGIGGLSLGMVGDLMTWSVVMLVSGVGLAVGAVLRDPRETLEQGEERQQDHGRSRAGSLWVLALVSEILFLILLLLLLFL